MGVLLSLAPFFFPFLLRDCSRFSGEGVDERSPVAGRAAAGGVTGATGGGPQGARQEGRRGKNGGNMDIVWQSKAINGNGNGAS